MATAGSQQGNQAETQMLEVRETGRDQSFASTIGAEQLNILIDSDHFAKPEQPACGFEFCSVVRSGGEEEIVVLAAVQRQQQRVVIPVRGYLRERNSVFKNPGAQPGSFANMPEIYGDAVGCIDAGCSQVLFRQLPAQCKPRLWSQMMFNRRLAGWG